MSSDPNSPPQTQTPSTPPAVAPTVASTQPFRCPFCATILPQITAYCSNCGNAIPPTAPVYYPVPPSPRSRTGLIIGVILIAIILAGGLGAFVYWNNQQQQLALQVAKTTEQTNANQAPNQIQPTCATVTPDNTHLFRDQYGVYSGYLIISETFGLSNPSRFIIDGTWTLTYNFTAVSLYVTSHASFHLPAGGTAYPVFMFTITGQQYNSLPSNPDFSQFTGTLDASYKVVGTYATYSVPQHLSLDSSSSSNGNTGSGSNEKTC